jgi:hypothetical protein
MQLDNLKAEQARPALSKNDQHFLRKSCTVHHQLNSFVVILSKIGN